MRVQVHDHITFTGNSLATHTERRVKTALSRYLNRIRRVFIEFSETDGGGYRPATRCFIRVETACGQTVALDDTRNCAFAALDKALGTVKRMVKGTTHDTTAGAYQ